MEQPVQVPVRSNNEFTPSKQHILLPHTVY